MQWRIGSVMLGVLALVGCQSVVEDEDVAFRAGLSGLSPAATNLGLPARIMSVDTFDCAQVAAQWGKPLREDDCDAYTSKQKFGIEQYHQFALFRLTREGLCVTAGTPSGGTYPLALGHCGQGNASDELFFFADEIPTTHGLEAEIRSIVAPSSHSCLQAGWPDARLRLVKCDGSSSQRFLVESFDAFAGWATESTTPEGSSGGETGEPPPPPPPPPKPGPCPLGEECCLGEPEECILCMPPDPGCP